MTRNSPRFDSRSEREFFDIAQENGINQIEVLLDFPGSPISKFMALKLSSFFTVATGIGTGASKDLRARTNLTHWNSVFSRQVRRDNNVLYRLRSLG